MSEGQEIPTQELEKEAQKNTSKKIAPQFLRQFSKETNPEGRKAEAQKIRTKRAEYFDRKRGLTSRQEEIAEDKNSTEEKTENNLINAAEIEATLDELSSDWFKGSLKYFEIKKLRGERSLAEISHEELTQTLINLETEEKEVARKLERKGVDAELEKAREYLEKFYKDEKDRWESTPYNKEDIKRYFSEEYLISLPLQEYKDLLKRFNTPLISHVTRQGVRDHTGHMYHTSGRGEFSSEFAQILEDGKLRSVFGRFLKNGAKKEALSDLTGIDTAIDKKMALSRLSLLESRMSDTESVHFAIDEVANDAYGGETGNEIFFAFPSPFVAANFRYDGQSKNYQGSGFHNDHWVFPKDENDGININAGIVFIPHSAMVDESTGSKYELDEQMKPIENEDYIRQLRELVGNGEFYDAVQNIKKILDKYPSPAQKTDLKNLRDLAENTFSLNEDFLSLAFDPGGAGRLIALCDSAQKEIEEEEEIVEGIKSTLTEAHILYKTAPTPILSKDFWEDYFSKHPYLKPNKIVWYEGEPTDALRRLGPFNRNGDAYQLFPENMQTIETPPLSYVKKRRELVHEEGLALIEERFPE